MIAFLLAMITLLLVACTAAGVETSTGGSPRGIPSRSLIYANDSLIATVSVTNQGITVLHAEGAEVAKTDLMREQIRKFKGQVQQ